MIYDRVVFNQNKHALGFSKAFRRALFPDVAADIMVDVLSVGGGREDFIEATDKLALEVVL